MLIGYERGEDYVIEIGFLSGYYDRYGVMEFDVELNLNTAGIMWYFSTSQSDNTIRLFFRSQGCLSC